MRSYFFLFIAIFTLSCQYLLQAQSDHHGLHIEKIEPASSDYLLLWQSNKALHQDNMSNELILDMVEVMVVDSQIGGKYERHRFVGGRVLRTMGWNWRPINQYKEKFVGTAVKHVRIPKDEFLSEYDINWDLSSRIGKYFQLAFDARQRQVELNQRMKKFDTGQPPFTYPSSTKDVNLYRMHCEWTPMDDFREEINTKFLPCIPGTRMETHPNFGQKLVSIGLYGSYCSDCNHSCHPEIHPYEWIWWLNLHPDQLHKEHTKTWLLGLLVEGSKRFPNWSPAPRTGSISIPFIFPASAKTLHIRMDHLVHGTFNDEGFSQLKHIPEEAESLNWTAQEFEFEYPGLAGIQIKVTTNKALDSKAIKLWFDDLGFDPEKGLIYGKLKLAASVNELYTARIVFQY